jgi:hypothetical protein
MALGPGWALASTAQVKRALAVLSTLVAFGACERSKPAGVSEDTRVPPAHTASTANVLAAWDSALGAVIATPSVESGVPMLFVRDTASTADLDVELFSHDSGTARAKLHPTARVHSCAWERSAALSLVEPQTAPPSWTLALARGVALPVMIDGIGELLPRDSAALAARISRLVSALPDDAMSAPYRGLPIVVRDAWRFQVPDDSTQIAVAVAARTLNVESNPRSEVVTIIAEPDPSVDATAWHAVFVRRDAGPEDRIEGSDLLAALRLRNGHSAVALLRDDETGSHVEIVERVAPGSWRLRWSSAALACAR